MFDRGSEYPQKAGVLPADRQYRHNYDIGSIGGFIVMFRQTGHQPGR